MWKVGVEGGIRKGEMKGEGRMRGGKDQNYTGHFLFFVVVHGSGPALPLCTLCGSGGRVGCSQHPRSLLQGHRVRKHCPVAATKLGSG